MGHLTVLRGAAVLWTVALMVACKKTPDESLLDAAHDGDMAAVKGALAANANVNAANDWGDTPLTRASAGCHLDVVETLLAAGADVNKQAHNVEYKRLGGWTALGSAAGGDEPGCPAVIKALLAAGAAVNAQDDAETTALGMAATECRVEAAQLLVGAGADVNAGIVPPLALASGQPPAGAFSKDCATLAQMLREHGAHGT